MRKLFLLSLLAVFVIVLSCVAVSCGESKTSLQTTDAVTTDSLSAVNPKETLAETKDTTSFEGEESESDPLMLHFEDLKLYRAYMEKAVLPDNFVYYDDLAAIGDFGSFSCLHPDAVGEGKWLNTKDDDSTYYYNLIDGENAYLLFVSPKERAYLSKAEISSDRQTSTDMRRLDEEQSGVLLVDTVKYYYYEGQLSSINWTCDGVFFTLDLPNHSFDAKSSFVNGLLNRETASDEIKSFQETLAQKQATKE